MKNLLIAGALLVVLNACSSSSPLPEIDDDAETTDPVEKPEDNPYFTGKDLTTEYHTDYQLPGDINTFSVLGYGYDMTEKEGHPSGVRAKVWNTELYYEDKPDAILRMRLLTRATEYILSGTEEECRRQLEDRLDLRVNGSNVFKKSTYHLFDQDTSYPYLDYKYLINSDRYSKYLYRILIMRNKYENNDKYLDKTFLEDIQTLDAKSIIQKYGTHVITGIRLGVRTDYAYRYIDRPNFNVLKWASTRLAQQFNVAFSTSHIGELDGNAPLKENIYLEKMMVRGDNINTWMVDITNRQSSKLHLESLKDVESDQITLIGFGTQDKPIPIYELINDPTKKEEVEAYHFKYLNN